MRLTSFGSIPAMIIADRCSVSNERFSSNRTVELVRSEGVRMYQKYISRIVARQGRCLRSHMHSDF